MTEAQRLPAFSLLDVGAGWFRRVALMNIRKFYGNVLVTITRLSCCECKALFDIAARRLSVSIFGSTLLLHAFTANDNEVQPPPVLAQGPVRKPKQGEVTLTGSSLTGFKKGNRPPLPLLLQAMSSVVRPAMLDHFPPNCCIATSAILRRAFRYFGYDAHPLTVSVQIYNSNMMRLLQSGKPLPDESKECMALFKRSKAWGSGIGIGPTLKPLPSGFDGHVVLKVGKTLVDASLAQADRAEYDVDLGPFINCEPGPEFFQGADQPSYGIERRGCVVLYKRLLNKTYQNSNEWMNWMPVYAQTLNRIIVQTTERMIAVLGGVDAPAGSEPVFERAA